MRATKELLVNAAGAYESPSQLDIAGLLRFLRLIGDSVKVWQVMADVSRGQDLLAAGSMDVPRFEGEAGEAQ